MPKRRARGDGAIYYDKTRKTYIGQITVGVDERGKRQRKTVYGKSKTEIKEKIRAVEYRIFEGTFARASDITVYQLAKQLLDDKLNQGEIKENTYFRSIETMKQLQPLYHIPLQALNESQARAFLLSKVDYSQSYVNKIYELLSNTTREALKRKIITADPLINIKRPRSKQKQKKVRALTREEQRHLLEVLQIEDITYSQQMLLSLFTGLRMGEVNALMIEDISFPFGSITVRRTISRGQKGEATIIESTKTEAGTRTIPMTSEVQSILRDCIGDRTSGMIFLHKDRLVTTSQVNATYRRVLKKYGIVDPDIPGRVDLHSLRHTFGTRCIEGGMSFKALQSLMGHTDIKITMNTYAEAQRDFIDENIAKVGAYLEESGLTLAATANW